MVKKDGAELPGSEPISFPITIMVVAYLLQLTQSATTSTELGMFHLTRLEPLKTIQIQILPEGVQKNKQTTKLLKRTQ